MKKNRRKATIGTTIALLAIFVSFGSSSPTRAASAARRAIRDRQTSKHPNSRRTPAAITLTVHVLHTTYGIPSQAAYRYPKSVSLRNAGPFADQIAAYGAAYRVWIVPKGWTGTAAVGVDGSTVVGLHPANGSAKSGPRFYYEDTGGCAGCSLDGATPYFPCAMQEYKELFDSPPLSTVPHGVKVVSLSPSLAMYTGSEAGGLSVRGVAHFSCGTNDYFFQRVEFVLPHTDAKLLHFLMHTFVRREKLK